MKIKSFRFRFDPRAPIGTNAESSFSPSEPHNYRDLAQYRHAVDTPLFIQKIPPKKMVVRATS